jgi:hypothetical protein
MKTLVAVFGGALLYWLCALLYLGAFSHLGAFNRDSGIRSAFADVSENHPKPLKAYTLDKDDVVPIQGNVTKIYKVINVGSEYQPVYKNIPTNDRCGIFTLDNKNSKYRFSFTVYTYDSTSKEPKDVLVTSIPQKDDDYMHIEINDGSCLAHITLDKNETFHMIYG